MRVLVGSLFLGIVFSSSAYVLLGDDDDSAVDIKWPTEYYFKGQTVFMHTGLVHPFKIWYSIQHKISRMELYGGEINSYFVGESDDGKGGLYKLLTTTTKNMSNIQQCRIQSGMHELKDFLPKTDFMNNTQSFTINGKVVQEWKMEDSLHEVFQVENTLLLYRTEYGVDVPVSYEEKKFFLESGKLLSHTLTEYYDFSPSVRDEELEIDNKKDCTEFDPDNLPDILKFFHPASPLDVDIAFDGYKNYHKKMYMEEEHEFRKTIFHKNWRLIEDHNRKNLGYKMAVNQFADRTDEELQFLTGTRLSDSDSKGTHAFHTLEEVDRLVDQLPEEFDLRLKGALRPVKNQGNCLASWAFTAAGVVEGALSYRLNRDVDLSEQSLIECSWGYGNYGCVGGKLEPVFKYILDQGIPTDVDYGQYKQEDGVCHVQNLTSTFKIRGFGRVNHNSAASLKLALFEYGPIAVSMMTTHNMYFYESGIFHDIECEGGKGNHGLAVVGYGTRHGDLFWIARNSWGEGWGEDGYILMSAKENNCFLLDDPYYVIV